MFKNKVKNLIYFAIVFVSVVFANNALAAGSDGVSYAFSSGGKDLNWREFTSSFYGDGYYVNNDIGYNPYNYNPYLVGKKPQEENTTTTVNRNYNINTSRTSDISKTNTKVATSTSSNTGVTRTANTRNVNNANSVNLANTRDVNDSVYQNLGASAFGSVRTSGGNGFMPNTFFGWLLVALLIMAIIVLYRVIVRKSKNA